MKEREDARARFGQPQEDDEEEQEEEYEEEYEEEMECEEEVEDEEEEAQPPPARRGRIFDNSQFSRQRHYQSETSSEEEGGGSKVGKHNFISNLKTFMSNLHKK